MTDMRRGILIAILCVAGVLGVLAGTFYDRTYFAGDVGLYSWTAPTNFAAAPATGGEYTNAATIWYRICGTNAAGRTPWATNAIALGGGTASNAVALTWDRRDGVTGYWLERCTNGTTWTDHRAIAVSALGYTDTHGTNWTAGTNSMAPIGVASVPWATPGITNGFNSAVFLAAGGLSNNVPRWGEDVTNAYSGSKYFLIPTDDTGQMHWRPLGYLIGAGILGSVVTNPTTAFALASHSHPLSSITNAGTIAGRGSNDYVRATFWTGSAAWPRTWLAPGVYYTHTDGASGGALAAIGYSQAVFPEGQYTNVARASVQVSFTTNAVFNRYYATNFTIRVTACGPGGPSNPDGVYSSWAVGRDFQPTNNASWMFQNSGTLAIVSATNLVLNLPAPTYDTIPARLHAPMVYLLNSGAQPVSNVFLNFVIEYDNGAAN